MKHTFKGQKVVDVLKVTLTKVKFTSTYDKGGPNQIDKGQIANYLEGDIMLPSGDMVIGVPRRFYTFDF